jgi:putative membrane protein
MASDDETPVHATDALANERTFLAYLRTALALVAFGFVIARFALFAREFAAMTHRPEVSSGTTSILLGASMAVAGIVTALFGAWRYIVAASGLREGRVIPLARRPVLISSIAVSIVCLVVAIDLILVR